MTVTIILFLGFILAFSKAFPQSFKVDIFLLVKPALTILEREAPLLIKLEAISITLTVVLECWKFPVSPQIPSIKKVAVFLVILT